MITFVHNDGGRAAAGFKGIAGDCVTRAVSIASGIPYETVYARLAMGNKEQKVSAKAKASAVGRKSARDGIYMNSKWFAEYMREIGFVWVATMRVGSGCMMHVNARELPKGNLVLRLSKHGAAVIDGVLHDTYDCSRDGTRCVYGYWIKK